MITFWLIVGVLIVVTLLVLVPPLLRRSNSSISTTPSEVNLSVYRDQLRELDADLAAGTLNEVQYQNARSDLESRVLEDSGTAEITAAPSTDSRWGNVSIAALIISVPLLAISLYFILGTPAGLKPQIPTAAMDEAHPATPEQFEAMVTWLAERLKAEPDNAEGWVMLARSYTALNRYQDASAAYARAVALQPNNASVLADHADMLAMLKQTLQGEPEKIIQQALKIDPDNLKALSLAGSAAFERKNYSDAIKWWEKILNLLPADSPVVASVSTSINEARGLAGLPPVAAAPAGGKAATQSNVAKGSVSGTIRLDPAFKARIADTDTVFIFARAVEDGRKPPLAVLRKTVKDLPFDFTLDDSMSMVPSLNLSSVTNVIVGARISKSGNVISSSKDLEGFSKPVKIGQKDIVITIDSEVK
ncbi:c-type cytochrome biogenesis protein CcmI [Candidatus Nitrotoga sp. AM1P]|uniref:c-type cytochrome biogenesis protein CcmI n=1 Tax=Candidatus Nitrotoga sp. AM1P TaxID=2559597 RepID=UPI0010B67205|nr:c-type cytochrome biogenesis protein CcmI [Candidatus Nitrotoga sp. AM1P]BBJ23769.1 c-type cytochrome biogenesis protein CcmI [Candidatus Nitrotoga sp. AM1P]